MDLKKKFKLKDSKLIFVKICLVAIPSYSVALITEKIFYVVPTIAMMLIISNSVENGNSSSRNRIDDDGVTDDGDAESTNEMEGGT